MRVMPLRVEPNGHDVLYDPALPDERFDVVLGAALGSDRVIFSSYDCQREDQ